MKHSSKNKSRIFLILGILLFTNTIYAQTINKRRIGISLAGFGESDFIQFRSLAGASSTSADNFFALGLEYITPINQRLSLETGFNMSHQNATVMPNLPPNIDYELISERFIQINVPVYLRLDILKYVFIHGGFLLDFDPNLNARYDNQTGIGFGAGMGIQYQFNNDWGIYLSPFMKMHSLVPFSMDKNHERYFENAVKLGITLNL